MADNEFLTAQVTIKANLERLKTDLAAAKKEVYRTVDELSARAAKGDVDKLAKRSALIHQRDIKDQIKAENDLLRSLRDREVQNNKIAREHRRAVNDMVQDLKRFSREAFLMGAGITAAMGYTVKKYADAEKAMRVAVAITDTAPTEEVFKKLYIAAEDAAIRFNLSIQEISKAFDVLKVSGYTAEQQMAILPTLVSLAKGSVTDTGLVADKILDLMDAFSISIENLDTVSNQLAYGSTHARTSLNELMDGLMSIGNIAQMTGNDFQDMVATIMIMADAGTKGSQATMALRRIMIDLMNTSSKGAKALSEYMDIYAHFTDGTKAIKPFKQIIDELALALKRVDPAIRDSLLIEWFGQRAVAGGLAVFKGGSTQIEEYAQAIRNSGTAVQNLVDYQLKALWEQLGILGQQLMALVRRIGAGLVPAIEQLNTTIRPTLKALREWMDLNPQLVQSLSEMTAVLGIALVSTGALGLGIRSMYLIFAPLIPLVKVFGAAVLGAFGFWPIAIFTAVAALYAMRAAWNQNMGAIQDRMQWVVDTVKTSLDWLANTAFGQFFINLWSAFTNAFQQLREGWLDFFAGLAGIVFANLTTTGHYISNWAKSVKATLTGHPIEAINIMKTAMSEIPEVWSAAFLEGDAAARGHLTNFKEYVGQTFETAGIYLKAYGLATGENIGDMLEAVKLQFKADLDSLIGMLSSKFPQFVSLLEKYRNEVLAGVGVGSPFGKSDGRGDEVQFKNWQLGLQKYYNEINKWDSFVQESVKQTAHSIESGLGNAFAKIGDQGNTFKSVMNDIFRGIGEEIRNLMGQFAARIVMKSTIEVLFPNLAGILNPGTAQLQIAGTTLQTAAVSLQAAAAQLSASAGMSGGGGGGNLIGALFGGSGGTTGGMSPGQVGSGGSFGNAGGADMTMGSYAHGGGTVGSFISSLMPASLFNNAPRFHNGLKLKADEFPTILQRGEEVKSRRDVAKDKESSRTPMVNDNRLRIINVMDKSVVKDYLRSSEGERVILNVLQRNPNMTRG